MKAMRRLSGAIRKTSGFSLVELMAVVGIIGIMAAVTVPIVSNMIDSYRVQEAGRGLLDHLHGIRSEAIRANAQAVMVFDSGAYTEQGGVGSYTAFLDENGDWVQDANERVLIPATTMPAKVSLVDAAFTDNGNGDTNMAGFNNHGLAARATTSAFVFGSAVMRGQDNAWRRVRVQPTGMITLQKSTNGTDWE
jgi:prepilin-type N-terminal cleavage/methylation domain-containing protein